MCKSKLCARLASINISSSGQEDTISQLDVYYYVHVCVCMRRLVMPHAKGRAECCGDEYNVDVSFILLWESIIVTSFASIGRQKREGGEVTRGETICSCIYFKLFCYTFYCHKYSLTHPSL